MSHDQQPPTSLEIIEQRFITLAAPPISLSFSGAFLGVDFPDREIPIDELRILLLKRQTTSAVKNAVWGEIVRRVQDNGEPWTTAALGLTLPILLKAARKLRRPRNGDLADIDSEIVEGLLHVLNSADPDESGIYWTILNTAKRYGFEARRREDKIAVQEKPAATRYQRSRTGHPDLVLARAVEHDTLSTAEANLIGRVRLDGQSISSVADEQGIPVVEAEFRLDSAEKRLVMNLDNLPPAA